jgi:hypothetical protein
MGEVAENRPLSAQERKLAEWMLAQSAGGLEYSAQLQSAWVVARCPCGCASVDFAIAGQRPEISDPMRIVADFIFDTAEGHLCGVFLFAKGKLLAGLEVYSIDGNTDPVALPEPAILRPFQTGAR